ncbi:FAD-dependent oxidoreductase [Jannaschia rubra]|uniref:FAD-dependent oxidoreductase n=1 Tax=Jannaschia rubra TaxID=282197 RepID=UPI002490CFB3|nr:FAD-dependent oxidoreductase [Jannaschia rubra]
MKRATLSDLTAEPVDVLVIGGGIYGLMVARDAALRGLATMLVDRGDFGGEASDNSLKIMHGGIRYVQHLDIGRMRASARERAFWQRAAPGLIRPLDFVIPLFGHGVKGPEAFAAAAAIYRLVSTGLRGPDYGGGGVIGQKAARTRLGALAPDGLTGGGVWRDGQIIDANRLHLACLRAGVDAGLRAANHMDAVALIRMGDAVTGARLRDRLTGQDGEVHARVTLCCAGAATPGLTAPVLPDAPRNFPGFARATNIVTDRPADTQAIGIVSRSRSDAVVARGGRMYFLTPWQGRTIIGTHEAGGTDPRDPADIAAFLAEIAAASPALVPGNVLWAYQGLIPADVDDGPGGPRRQTRGTLIDHSQAGGPKGLISVMGVKYTTARLIAERAVDCAASQIGRGRADGRSFAEDLPDPGLAVFDPADEHGLADRVRTAFDDEMAQTLSDVLLRRTTLAETGQLAGSEGRNLLERTADIAARIRGWDAERRAVEVAAVCVSP